MNNWKNTFWIPEDMLDRVDKLVERYPGVYYKVKSWTRPIYHLVKHEGDRWICDCEDYSFRYAKNGGMCDHIRKCRHIRTKYHSEKKKRLKEVLRARRQLLILVNRFVRQAHRLEWYELRSIKATKDERYKYYRAKWHEIHSDLAQIKRNGEKIIKKYPELETPEKGKNEK